MNIFSLQNFEYGIPKTFKSIFLTMLEELQMIKNGLHYITGLKKNWDVYFLQETHFHLRKDENKWSREWKGQSI